MKLIRLSSTLLIVLCFLTNSYAAPKKKVTQKLPQKTAQDVPSIVTPEVKKTEATVQKKERAKRPSLDNKKSIRMTYALAAWNKDSTKIDSGSLIMKDKASGMTVQVELQETAPDSSTFSTTLALTWTSVDGVVPEIYFVPPSQQTEKRVKGDLNQMIESGQAIRKPFILTKDDRGIQNLDVYESREQAERALIAFKEKTKEQPKEQPVQIAAKALFEAEKLAQLEREKKKLEEEARAREAERMRQEQLERQKAEERVRQQKAMAESEKKKRREQAIAFAETALDFFRLGNFKQAEENFEKSVELDPENKAYYYKYGITLYRNENFNKSLVYLNLSEGAGFDPIERDYYVGLNHFRLKEYSQSLNAFDKVENKTGHTLAPSASFYKGLVRFSDAQYEKAKEDFQRVLDTSTDPKLDESAEEYMEKIDGLLMYAKNREKPFLFSLTVGPQYDSNVLLVSDATAASGAGASDQGSIRYQLGSSLQYRPVYSKEFEFGPKVKTDYLYTQKDELDDYDFWTINGSLPFVYKGVFVGQGIKMEFIPGYERMYLGQDSGGNPKESMNSFLFDALNNVVMSDRWFLGLNIKYRNDTYKDTPTSDANKITVSVNNTLFLNKGKTQAGVFDLGYTTNDAKADASDYSKIDFSGVYMTPVAWDVQAIAGLTGYLQNYAKQAPARNDTNYSVNFSLARPINEWLKAVFNGAYTINDSSIESNKYKKFVVGMSVTADFQF